MGMGRIRDALKPIEHAHVHVDRWIKEIPNGMQEQIPCKKGCDRCCYQFVVVSVPEAMYMIGELMKWNVGRDWIKEHHKLLNEQAAFCKGYTEARLGEFQDKWFEAQKPCFFLERDSHTCKIYDRRPIVCRAHFTLDSAEKCAGPVLQEIKLLQQTPALVEAIAASMLVGKNLRINDSLCPLPIAVIWALVGYHNGIGELRKMMKPGSEDIWIKL